MDYKWKTRTGKENLEMYLDNLTTVYISYLGRNGLYKNENYYKSNKIVYD